jgi:alkanesulfonate monooxygenase SsuD/methylene tetrahydromethanopterin reductase-like flavin-dependent oxidoreductase (luciferase family)
MTFMAIAPDAAASRAMADELATKTGLTPEALAARTLVGTPDEIAAWLRTLTDLGVSHHILQIQSSDQWPNYADALELVAREVIPRVRHP